ncbi:MAG: CTP synthase [Bacilli bacterium]|nr:CTP synthase [Bacilli bacterium]MDY4828870.1 CTP synthase [Bacilli bacterium]MDY5249218.1 CTP synthase [Bacilli bacterium]MDY5937609.1 CTP synthase [Bacilli bacterium]MDY6008379.1 CTP synthase [Bacilli bacterium]
MNTKFIFVTGGVVSSLGKGISAASLGRMLSKRGLKVFMQKFDPYLNVDPGTMSPYQHGEVFVTEDGAETDLDLGHYERFTDLELTKESSVTSGKIYKTIIEKERRGDYLGSTVQVIPHVTNEIKQRLLDAAEVSKADVVITEIGGTVGDIESLPFLEAIRQARADFGYENTFYLHNTLVPFLKTSGEIKTKPTQHSVKELTSLGIQPDAIILRSEVPVDVKSREKIALFCNVPPRAVFVAQDVQVIYEVGISLNEQGLDDYVLEHFHLGAKKADMTDWINLVDRIKHREGHVDIALVGKYVELHDAYISVNESLRFAGYFYNTHIKIHWIDSAKLTESNYKDELKDIDGVLVPGGFGERGTDGKKLAIKYARENNIPFFGICLGLQLALIEYANDVLHLEGANTSEFDPTTPYPVVDYLPDQYKGIKLGGTMRLGSYDCIIEEGTKAYEAYKQTEIKERHRHRYEVNRKYLDKFDDGNFIISGKNPQTGLTEIIELRNHPWFVACQFHPEFKSRPLNPHPLFREFINHAIKYKESK